MVLGFSDSDGLTVEISDLIGLISLGDSVLEVSWLFFVTPSDFLITGFVVATIDFSSFTFFLTSSIFNLSPDAPSVLEIEAAGF